MKYIGTAKYNIHVYFYSKRAMLDYSNYNIRTTSHWRRIKMMRTVVFFVSTYVFYIHNILRSDNFINIVFSVAAKRIKDT